MREPPLQVGAHRLRLVQLRVLLPDILFLKHANRILRQSTNPVWDFSIMKKVRLCAVWPMENWLGSAMNKIQGWNLED